MNQLKTAVAFAVALFVACAATNPLLAQTPAENRREGVMLTLADVTGGKTETKTAIVESKQIRTEDVVYGRRDGHALTMDVIAPKGAKNGAGVVVCVSAEYRSSRDLLNFIHPRLTTPFLDRGYVVFAVMHSSQPMYTLVEAVADVHRAVRFIKANAKQYSVDPAKLGITGGSAGGQLSLMMGCAGKVGDPLAKDEVERHSSKVAAVACFFPPTDFLALKPCSKELEASFDFREFDTSKGKFATVTLQRRDEIAKELSPMTHVAKDSAPSLIIHGGEDKLVPVKQSKLLIDKMKECGVACELSIKPGAGHMWLGMEKDVTHFVDWFDRHLLGKKK